MRHAQVLGELALEQGHQGAEGEGILLQRLDERLSLLQAQPIRDPAVGYLPVHVGSLRGSGWPASPAGPQSDDAQHDALPF